MFQFNLSVCVCIYRSCFARSYEALIGLGRQGTRGMNGDVCRCINVLKAIGFSKI